MTGKTALAACLRGTWSRGERTEEGEPRKDDMRIGDILRKENILPALQATTKRDVLEELARALARGLPDLHPGQMVAVLLEREKLGSTGIGDGIAIPHGKIPGLGGLMLSFGRSQSGIDFDAMDNRPVRLFFLLAAPEDSAGLHLKALAKISRMLKDGEFRRDLLAADTGDALYRLILAKDETC